MVYETATHGSEVVPLDASEPDLRNRAPGSGARPARPTWSSGKPAPPGSCCACSKGRGNRPGVSPVGAAASSSHPATSRPSMAARADPAIRCCGPRTLRSNPLGVAKVEVVFVPITGRWRGRALLGGNG